MKIAMAQINPVIADIEGNRNKILSFIKAADVEGADLIVFPELSTIGYPPMDLLENKKLVKDNLLSLEKIKDFSRGIKSHIIIGFADFDYEKEPMLFNSAALIKGGEILFKQNKTLIPGYDIFDENRYFSSAREHEVFDIHGVKTGITICEDFWDALNSDNSRFMKQSRYSVDPVQILRSKGTELVINISASSYTRGKRKARKSMLCNLALKNNVSIVYVNQTGANDSIVFDGSSMCINSKGEVYSQCSPFKEDLVLTEFNAARSDNMKADDIIDDMEDIEKALIMGISDYMKKSGFKKALLGISGGIDSALVAVLACRALGQENVFGITMPSIYSSKGSVDDSYELAQNLGMEIETIEIKNLFNQFKKDLEDVFQGMEEDITEENIQARIRGDLLMAVSNKTGALLLSASNKSETSVGYTTLYGDMCGGLAVISDLPKTLVYELSEHINKKAGKDIIPRAIIEKAPSAELRPDQKDEDSLPPYSILDGILELYIEERMSADEITAKGYERETVDFVLRLVNNNEYKRFQAAPGIRVTTKAFGTGRRIPLAKRFVP